MNKLEEIDQNVLSLCTLETIEHEIEKSNKVSVKVVECRKKIKDAVQKHKEKINSLTTTVSSPQYNMTSKTIKAALSSTQASTSTKPDRIMDRITDRTTDQTTDQTTDRTTDRTMDRIKQKFSKFKIYY